MRNIIPVASVITIQIMRVLVMKKNLLLAVLVLSLTVGAAYSDETDELQAIKNLISSVVPNGKADRISPTPITDVYEVVIGADVIYVTKDARYMFQGDLIDWTNRINHTEQARNGIRKNIISRLDEKEMIVFTPENPKYTVTVFTDIDCGYCRKLHSEIDKYKEQGIAIRYVAYPRSGLNTPSYFKAVAAWCSKDRQAALTAAKAGQAIEKEIEDCNDPVAKHLQMAYELGLRGTPSLILDDGRLLPGYVPAEKLVEAINEKR
jgi:thiol:disulfide interchange protein DsbC